MPTKSPEPLPYKASIPKGLKEQPLFRWSGSGMAAKDKSVLLKKDVDFLPSLDQAAYYPIKTAYNSDSDSERDAPAGASRSNLHNKRKRNSQFMRHGKLSAWTPFYEDVQTDMHARRRLNACLEQFMPAAAADVDADLPANIENAIARRKRRKLEREQDARYILPHLRSPSPPKSSEELAPMLAIPESYIDIMVSPSMRHALGDDTVEQGLQRTVSELLEGEKPLMQALGRMRDIMRLRQRDVQPLLKPRFEEERNGDTAAQTQVAGAGAGNPDKPKIPDLPVRHETDNLWRSTQELIQNAGASPPTLTYTASNPRDLPDESHPRHDQMSVTPVQALFTVPEGITLSATYPEGSGRRNEQFNIKLRYQVTAVDDALERLSELLSDCNEYKERLEEARDRIADVARARKKVWAVVKSRASAELDRLDEKDEKEPQSRAQL